MKMWERDFALYMYKTQERFFNGLYGNQKISFNEYLDIVCKDATFFETSYATMFAVGYSAGMSNAFCVRNDDD